VQPGDQLRSSASSKRAQAICETLVRDHPTTWRRFITLGLVHLDKGDYQRAHCLGSRRHARPAKLGTMTALSAVYLAAKRTRKWRHNPGTGHGPRTQQTPAFSSPSARSTSRSASTSLPRMFSNQALALEPESCAAAMGAGEGQTPISVGMPGSAGGSRP